MMVPRLFLAVSDDEALMSADFSCLSESERHHADLLKNTRRRHHYVCGRVLMRFLLEKITGVAAADHEIVSSSSGMPVSGRVRAISISHSNGQVACAAATAGTVGVDIERIDCRRDVNRVAAEYFSTDEVTWVAGRSDRFHMLWVLKESWLKATGQGLGGGLATLQARVDLPNIEISLSQDLSCAVHLFSLGEYYIAVASDDMASTEIETFGWNPGTRALCPDAGLQKIGAGFSARAMPFEHDRK